MAGGRHLCDLWLGWFFPLPQTKLPLPLLADLGVLAEGPQEVGGLTGFPTGHACRELFSLGLLKGILERSWRSQAGSSNCSNDSTYIWPFDWHYGIASTFLRIELVFVPVK